MYMSKKDSKIYLAAAWGALIKDGKITVNGKQVKAGYPLTHGDEIVVEIPEEVPLEIKAAPIPLDIIYEDHDVIVVNKPRGMVVHPAPGNEDHTLVKRFAGPL